LNRFAEPHLVGEKRRPAAIEKTYTLPLIRPEGTREAEFALERRPVMPEFGVRGTRLVSVRHA